MPHGKAPSRRYAGRVLLVSLLGWALFAKDEEPATPPDDYEPTRPFERRTDLLDLGELDVSWDDGPGIDVPRPAAGTAEPATARAVRPSRRLASSLVFAALFFAGAALSAGAGDTIAEAVDSGSTATVSTTAGEAPASDASDAESTSAAEQDSEPGADPPPTESVPTEGGSSGGPADDGSSGEPADDGSSGEPTDAGSSGEPGGDPGAGSTEPPADPGGVSGDPGPAEGDGGSDPVGSEPVGPGSEPVPVSGGENDNPVGNPTGGHPADQTPAGSPLFDPPASPATDAAEVDPEVGDFGAATVWLHRTLPDPVPMARRLTPGFARMLAAEARRANVDWALMLGVLRADGNVTRRPAERRSLRLLGARLARLGAARDEWSAVLALKGRTSFADRAVALARYDRAVGLRALVTGLDAAKPALERRVLADRRLAIYAGGRGDVASHRIDVRVLVTVRYLAEAFGRVTVSSLYSGHRLFARPGVVSAHVYGLALDVAALGGTSIAGHQAPGGMTEKAVREILLLPAELQPRQVISLLGLGGPSFALADHADHIHIGF